MIPIFHPGVMLFYGLTPIQLTFNTMTYPFILMGAGWILSVLGFGE